MATITAANLRAFADSVAKHIIDAAALPGSSAALTAGQATTLAKLAALADAAQENALIPGAYQSVANENAWLAAITSYNAILDLWAQVVQAVDTHVGGLLAFLRANTSQVDPHYLDAHNRAAQRTNMTPLAADVAYGQSGVAYASIAVTGSGAGTFSAGAAQNSSYGNAPMSLKNTGGGPTGAASATYTVTYNAYNAAGVLQTGLTASATVPNGTAQNGTVSLAVAGVAVTAITLTGGTNGDQISVVTTALRTPAY